MIRTRRKRDRAVTAKHGRFGHRSCGRKNRYPTRESAEGWALLFEAARGTPLRAYHCGLCDGWHLTSHVARVTDADGER